MNNTNANNKGIDKNHKKAMIRNENFLNRAILLI